MGNDGGSIPKRRELVKEAARLPTLSEMKATALESLAHAWATDPISSEPLDLDNAVSDWRGRLYNYETILQGLMPGEDSSADNSTEVEEGTEITFASTGIRSLRDIVKLKFHKSSNVKEKPVYTCPVSLKEIGPSTKAVYLVPCGHVFADIAMRQIQEETCPECSEPFRMDHVVTVLPTDKTELEKARKRIEDLRAAGLTHSLKKDKSSNGKKKRKAEKEDEGAPANKRQVEAKGIKRDAASKVSGINNAIAASLTQKVMAEQEERNKRRKMAAAR